MWSPGVTAAMVGVEFMVVGISTIMKAAMNKGMSQFVYIVYSNAFAIFILLPSSFIFYRERSPPKLNACIFSRILLLSIVSFSIQMLFNTGIKYSSPTLCTAMTDLTPAFTFLLSVIFRMEKLEFRLQSSQAKSIGTIVSVAGALIVTLYKGQLITANVASQIDEQLLLLSNVAYQIDDQLLLLSSNWVIGGIFCAVGALCLASLYIVQTWILKEYPTELMVTLISCIFVTLLSAVVSLIVEKDSNAWILKPDVELTAILCSAIFAVSLRSVVHAWACRKKGPLYTAMFKPLRMVIATFMGVSFLGDNLYVGSVIGGIIIALGFYTVIWGKSQEEKMDEEDKGNPNLESSSHKIPLLRNKSTDLQSTIA
ncbi:WAT1-related protein At3g28050 isoform X1 [Jatropha curcas]|uniref:WAT1-related protein At3g28050 isoform X1 n=1 Tax=Jatropha curcas TaxID=180498 RepID=UPI001894DF8C|nr:WAT1-related protein At3g28050 isoform X1 [Jatropha curcas]